jgi:hypothetical protein
MQSNKTQTQQTYAQPQYGGHSPATVLTAAVQQSRISSNEEIPAPTSASSSSAIAAASAAEEQQLRSRLLQLNGSSSSAAADAAAVPMEEDDDEDDLLPSCGEEDEEEHKEEDEQQQPAAAAIRVTTTVGSLNRAEFNTPPPAVTTVAEGVQDAIDDVRWLRAQAGLDFYNYYNFTRRKSQRKKIDQRIYVNERTTAVNLATIAANTLLEPFDRQAAKINCEAVLAHMIEKAGVRPKRKPPSELGEDQERKAKKIKKAFRSRSTRHQISSSPSDFPVFRVELISLNLSFLLPVVLYTILIHYHRPTPPQHRSTHGDHHFL